MSTPVGYEVEFRSVADDAWYNSWLVLHGEKLIVKFVEFTDDQNEVYDAGELETEEKLDDLKSRIRPRSLQVQDSECFKAVEGLHVCACSSIDGRDLRYFDAVIDDRFPKVHFFVEGEEECLCSFLLVWQSGPNRGNLVEKNVADICFIQSDVQPNPIVASFLKLARQKIESRSSKSVLAANGAHRKENWSPNIKQKSALAHKVMQEKDFAKQHASKLQPCEGRAKRRIHDADLGVHDADLGGVSNHHTILLENLENDVFPSAIVEFIHQQTPITPQAYVFPSLPSDLYTRGVITLENQKDLEDVYDFLNKPDHIIMSSRGRPWVVSRCLARNNLLGASLGTLMIKSQKRTADGRLGLKVVHRGTEEFKIAKELKDLFMEFTHHQERLYKRLASEERKILQSPSVK